MKVSTSVSESTILATGGAAALPLPQLHGMENELRADTPEGARLVALAERHAAEFYASAADDDREGRLNAGQLEALKTSKFLYAPAPVESGGLGVESVHDVMVATSRLARGSASLTLGVNMHLLALLSWARQRRLALNTGNERKAAAITELLRGLVSGGAAIAAAVSEPDQDLLHPATTAVKTPGGWVVNGRKIFCSMAPAATHFSTAVTYRDEEGVERYAYAIVPRSAPGVTVDDDWDALGMRASGSSSVTFDNAQLGERGPGRGVVAGILTTEHIEMTLASGPAHTSASLGVAEAGHRLAIEAVNKKLQRRPDEGLSGFVVERASENSIDLAAARAVFDRALRMIDQYEGAHLIGRGSLDEVTAVFAEVQRAKTFVNAAAVRILDRALAMSGGAGYMTANPLSRLYRDARAGAFMHPLGVNVAMEYLGEHTLGRRPSTF